MLLAKDTLICKSIPSEGMRTILPGLHSRHTGTAPPGPWELAVEGAVHGLRDTRLPAVGHRLHPRRDVDHRAVVVAPRAPAGPRKLAVYPPKT